MTQQKSYRALFLAALMVLSVVGGTIAFAGGAAAASPQVSSSDAGGSFTANSNVSYSNSNAAQYRFNATVGHVALDHLRGVGRNKNATVWLKVGGYSGGLTPVRVDLGSSAHSAKITANNTYGTTGTAPNSVGNNVIAQNWSVTATNRGGSGNDQFRANFTFTADNKLSTGNHPVYLQFGSNISKTPQDYNFSSPQKVGNINVADYSASTKKQKAQNTIRYQGVTKHFNNFTGKVNLRQRTSSGTTQIKAYLANDGSVKVNTTDLATGHNYFLNSTTSNNY